MGSLMFIWALQKLGVNFIMGTPLELDELELPGGGKVYPLLWAGPFLNGDVLSPIGTSRFSIIFKTLN